MKIFRTFLRLASRLGHSARAKSPRQSPRPMLPNRSPEECARLLGPVLSLVIATAASAADRPAAIEKPPAVGGSADLATAGRLLLNKLSCTTCHRASESQAKWLLPKTAPRLKDIGSRASHEWIQQYLASPNQTMPGGTMPDALAGLSPTDRAAAAEALTHYLLSQRSGAFSRIRPDRAAVARGEILYHRIGCVACHPPQKNATDATNSIPLPRMADKWSFDGLRRFLLDPLATRPSGRMPAMRLTDQEAADVAHYLLRDTRVPAAVEVAAYRTRVRSLDEIDSAELAHTAAADGFALDAAQQERRSPLRFTGWLRIDQAGDYVFYLTASGASRLSVNDKWLAGEESWEMEKVDAKVPVHLEAGWQKLQVDFVQRGKQPPALKLEWTGPGVAREVVPKSRLRADRDAVPEPPAFVVDANKAALGRTLYEKLNCAVCHEGRAPARPLPALALLNETRGCLAETPVAGTPDFHMNPGQRAAVRAALQALNRADLAAPTDRQRLAGALATFNCTACHSRDGAGGVAPDRDAYFTSNVADTGDEGRLPPRLDGVGDKLLPAWLEAVLTQGASVRPALDARMPQFGKENVGFLAELFVAIDRKPVKLAPVNDDPAVQKEVGRKLVGSGGLSCIACHRFNRRAAQTLQMIDLTTTPERLNEDWFRRFLLDPNRFHPGTRMPAFWPDGKSLLPAVLGGDTDRQHAAIWTYLSDGERAKFPEGLSREGVELLVGGEAVVYRGKLWEAGYRAVAIGYPGQLNAAFDAEEMRLSLLWRGRFLDAGPHWQVQGMGKIRPLGTDVVVFPHGSPLAVLADTGAPWPVQTSKELGMKFHGYQLDAIKRPTLLYSFGKTGIQDFLTPIEGKGASGLRRTVTFADAPPDGLYFRLAVGKLAPHGDGAWRLNDAMTLTVKGGAKAFTRGKGDMQELLVPVHFAGKSGQMEVDYAW